MAYNSGYNPDALPAHAEPEQAAAMLAGHPGQSGARPHAGSVSQNQGVPRPHAGSQSYNHGSPRPQAGSHAYSNRPTSPNYNKPAPPLPNQRPSHQQQPGGSYGGPQGGRPERRPSPYETAQSGQPTNYGQSPPPSGYGFGPPPQQQQNRPPQMSRPPPTPVPPAGADPTLFHLFKAVDKDNTGQLTEKELRAALVNGDWSTFDPNTVRMMIRMFDTNQSGSIGFDEFCGLWGFLSSWRTLFDRFDEDRSGNISIDEFTNALVGE
ncbi:MAG: hypothetical protein M1837_003782 [Sclerophora amabilis]|nr:MAG: hypothetical protein M1837_003782 [Sclerophora amabilis]